MTSLPRQAMADDMPLHDTIDVALFTTCDLGGGRTDELLRLMASVRRAIAHDGISVRHYVLLQRAGGGIPAALCGDEAYRPVCRSIPQRVSLSRARNILLAVARQERALESATWAAFPDDDAWYPDGLLREVTDLFQCNEELDLVTCLYGSHPQPIAQLTAAPVFEPVTGAGVLVRTVSSNTMMLRAAVVQATGYFDERLGVGAPVNGGEDLDFALRAFVLHGRQGLISRAALVGHRDRLRWVRSRYFAGSLFALARLARHDRRIAWQMARKLAVGAALAARGELAPADWWEGMRIGLQGLRRPEPAVAEMQPLS